ncbi:MAG: hypothetical protein J6C13_00825 [Clostridia bacterium]|nr:hypothetical protein [Clostridia bacterium]
MESSLIIIDKFYAEKDLPIQLLLKKFTSVGCKFDCVHLVNFDIDSNTLIKLFNKNTIIAVPFSETATLHFIKLATDQYFAPHYDTCFFGYTICNGINKCCIVDSTLNNLEEALDYNLLQKIFNTENSFCFKFFGATKSKIIDTINSIQSSQMFDLTCYDEFGDIQVCFIPKTDNQMLIEEFKRQLFEILGNFIYVDEPLTLSQCFAHLLNLRKIKLGYQDNYTSGEFEKFIVNIPNNRQYCINLVNEEFSSLEATKKYMFDNNFDMLLLITPIQQGSRITILNEVSEKIFDFVATNDLNFNRKYTCNLAIAKILQKLRKNAL